MDSALREHKGVPVPLKDFLACGKIVEEWIICCCKRVEDIVPADLFDLVGSDGCAQGLGYQLGA